MVTDFAKKQITIMILRLGIGRADNDCRNHERRLFDWRREREIRMIPNQGSLYFAHKTRDRNNIVY